MPHFIIDELGSHAGVRRTSSGGFIVPARLTRTGIFHYVIDGRSLRVLRPESEVFDKESIASLAHATVTVFHPQEREVTKENYTKVNVGMLADVRKTGNKYLDGDIVVQDGLTCERIEKKELSDVSMGYTMEWALKPGRARCADDRDQPEDDFVSGTDPVHGPYDRVHTKIRYNHVSLGPKGWGRAGDARIMLDGDHYLTSMDQVFAAVLVNDEADKPVVAPAPVAPTLDSIQEELKRVNDSLAQEKVRADKAEARADVLQSQLTTALAKVPEPTKVVDQAQVAARAALVTDARVLAPNLVTDGLTDEQVRIAAVTAFDAALGAKCAAKGAAYTEASFEHSVAGRKSVIDSNDKAASVLVSQVLPTVNDGDDPLAKAQAEHLKRYQA